MKFPPGGLTMPLCVNFWETLAQEEQQHEINAIQMTKEQSETGALLDEKNAARRFFVLRFIQPGLAGLMDGSVSTLAPVFAAAFATSNTGRDP